MNQRQTTIFDETVSRRIEALLARCDQLRRGSDCPKPVTFDRRGQAHAEAIARQEQADPRQPTPGRTSG